MTGGCNERCLKNNKECKEKCQRRCDNCDKSCIRTTKNDQKSMGFAFVAMAINFLAALLLLVCLKGFRLGEFIVGAVE